MKNSNIRLVSGEPPSRLLEEHSAARMHLAKLINDRLSIEATIRDLVAAGGKLAEAADAERNSGAKLAALDNEEAAVMSAWGKTGGQMPVLDQTRRAKLEDAVHAAVAQARAARSAASANGAEQARELGRLKALEPQFAIAIAEVLAESVEPLFSDFEIANKAMASKAEKIQQAFIVIRSLAESLGNPATARPIFAINEKLHERIRSVSGQAAPDGENHRAVWMAYAAKLRSDPITMLED